jgi:hypothetical protein
VTAAEPRVVRDAAERFWSKVDRNGPVPAHRQELGQCWVWLANPGRYGYGLFWFQGSTRRAPRVAFLLAHGRWPEPFALHHCDNPSCVNPAHLFEGTDVDNTLDKLAKGRQARGESHGSRTKPDRLARGERNGSHTQPHRRARGERNGCAKLTERDVREIRAIYALGTISQPGLSRRFGVSQSRISDVLLRKKWVHV